MKNPLKTLSKLFNRSEKTPFITTSLYENTFNQPLHVEPNGANAIIQAYLRGDTQLNSYADDSSGSRCVTYITDAVAILNISGVLTARPTVGDICSSPPLSYEELRCELEYLTQDDELTDIILQFSSCGGQAALMCDLSDYIYSLREKSSIKLTAMIDLQACSAAYGLASACSEIWITRTGVAGSIGTYVALVDSTKRNEMDGFKFTYIASDAHKLDGNPDEPLTDGAVDMFKQDVMNIDKVFKETVARNLGKDVSEIYNMEARWYRGEEAVKMGLAHNIGTMEDLINNILQNNDKIVLDNLSQEATMSIEKQEVQSLFSSEQMAVIESMLEQKLATLTSQTEEPAEEEEDDNADEIKNICAASGVSEAITNLFISHKIPVSEVSNALVNYAVNQSSTIDEKTPVLGLLPQEQKPTLKDSFSNLDAVEKARLDYLNSKR